MQIHLVQQQYKLCYSLLLHLACAETGNVKFKEKGCPRLQAFVTALPLRARLNTEVL